MVSVSQQKLRTRNKEAKKKQNKTKQKKQKIKSKKLRSWVSKKTRISKRHTEKQTSENQNGFFIAMPTLVVVVSSTTVFIYSKIENQFPGKGKKKKHVSNWSLID